MITEYATQGTCSRAIRVDIDPQTKIVNSVEIVGGCPGNTLGVGRLAAGRPVDEVIALCEGIDCRNRGTSCPDQLAKALRQAVAAIG